MTAPWARGAQLRIVGELHGQSTVNVIHIATNEVVNDGPLADDLLRTAVEALFDCVIETLLPAVTSDWRFIKTDGRMVYPTFGDPIEATGTPAHVGELSACSHSVTSTLLRLKSGSGGRSGRGRLFLPPAGEGEIAQSTIDAPTLVLIAAFATCVASKMMNQGSSTFWRIGVLSRKKLKAPGGTFDTAFSLVTSMTPVADVAYLGSRRKGRGA